MPTFSAEFRGEFSTEFSTDERVAPLADLFRLLGDPTRLKIVLLCVAGRRAVGAIADALGLSPSLVSHHLRRLRAARIVRAEREGKQVFYAAADAHIGAMLAGMLAHVAEPVSAGQEHGR
ncbi:HTH arsR-type domain-containing protein [Paraburkholderia tropica]|uniref:ArsR/SmtB family transcription factor n=1 Tax=Paraburkholderia TaxID=1822464 RepID=UPI001CAAD45E|nr:MULTISPECIES: metalloregulator ArsR/SmtB family transcription factor [Paraburkholderia]CAG9217050.1 HTH arsR-type domain-containing protein [Paraburkholderia tropica]